MRTLTPEEFRQEKGVSKRTLRRWKQHGVLVLNEDGRVDCEQSERNIDSLRPRDPTGEPEDGDLKEAIRRKEWALARLRELELSIKREEYISAREAEEDTAHIARSLREKLFVIPDRLCEELTLMDDAFAIRSLLRDNLEEAMRVFAEEERRALAEFEAESEDDED